LPKPKTNDRHAKGRAIVAFRQLIEPNQPEPTIQVLLEYRNDAKVLTGHVAPILRTSEPYKLSKPKGKAKRTSEDASASMDSNPTPECPDIWAVRGLLPGDKTDWTLVLDAESQLQKFSGLQINTDIHAAMYSEALSLSDESDTGTTASLRWHSLAHIESAGLSTWGCRVLAHGLRLARTHVTTNSSEMTGWSHAWEGVGMKTRPIGAKEPRSSRPSWQAYIERRSGVKLMS